MSKSKYEVAARGMRSRHLYLRTLASLIMFEGTKAVYDSFCDMARSQWVRGPKFMPSQLKLKSELEQHLDMEAILGERKTAQI